ncbi:hypothetical protein [Salipiger sp. CCB-MM3]|uniref:hypothetical protein n=1 Tax=Salipiger sp. CCB-MM3 TaxID=1792508 RepID=UPI0012F75A8B|nr:hypothetical protein [Salipiger sp. CCB-MM3]
MICEHNRLLSKPCIDCDPVAFFEAKLTEALDGPEDQLREKVTRWRDRAKEAVAERA